jgi:hypothetical protein
MFGEGMKNRLNPAKWDILRKKLERTASFPKKELVGISPRRMILRPNSLRAAPRGAASKPLSCRPKNREVQFGAPCLKMREPFLNETDGALRAPKTDSLGRGGQKKGYGENECPPRLRFRRRQDSYFVLRNTPQKF